jgi:RNA polymerase sigma factor (sigma-70 family)
MADDSETSIKIYLREIMLTPLLTAQQEIELAARMKKGDQKARAWMIKANLRLVVKIAHDYSNFGLPLLDLISEGNLGLMKAVERFDPAKGGKLSTYGAWWIKQSIKRALANQIQPNVARSSVMKMRRRRQDSTNSSTLKPNSSGKTYPVSLALPKSHPHANKSKATEWVERACNAVEPSHLYCHQPPARATGSAQLCVPPLLPK